MDLTIGTIIGDFILIAGSFLLLIFLVKKYAWGNITSILDARAEKITNDIDEAEAARQKAEELASKREEELAGSRKEAASIVENAKETAEKNKSQILSEATQEAVRLKEKAQQEIAHNKEEALNSIKGDVADLTVSLASKLLSQQLDAEGQRQLIDRYLDELGEA
ncbi:MULTISPECIES: F0F1 ATP synthase subunit B [unclassified Streptococcus]|uniref:F0F1 ATP synthase subunit B n=1 Tax=unclassified Streptococcus TaxID=2608887 RepID=UPI0039853C88